MSYVLKPPAVASVAVIGTTQRFAVHRIYCVGRNYEDHAKEMGHTGREPAFFLHETGDAVLSANVGETVATPYPTLTSNFAP